MPPGKTSPTERMLKRTRPVAKTSSMKKGDQYVLVCRHCESATVRRIRDGAEAAKLCHNGGKIHCDSCKKQVTIKHFGPRSKGMTRTVITYLNSRGEECMVLIPLKE